MIDHALDSGNRDAFGNLTGPYWKSYVVDTPSEGTNIEDPLAFLSQDPHFWDLRLYEKTLVRPYLNYRFRETIGNILYVAEIRIPIGWPGKIEATFRPRPSTGPRLCPPDWFQALVTTVTNVVSLEVAE